MKALNKEDIFKLLKQNKEKLKKYNVKKIGLFGSVLREEHTNESDIDIAIEIDKEKKNIHTFLALKREMESVFNKKVDLGIESSLKPIAREQIKKEIIYV